MEKLIISVGVNGGELSRKETPYLPITAEEIAVSVHECVVAGAAVAHVHVRDSDGHPCQDLELHRTVIDLIRAKCDVLINLSTDIRHNTNDFAMLAIRPEIASFPGGTVNFGEDVLLAPMPVLRELARLMQEYDIRPELEIFHEGMIGQCQALFDEGLLAEPRFYQFVLNVRGGAPADPRTLIRLVDSIPRGSPWGVVGVGEAGVGMAMMGILLGGHVRVGIEDQYEYSPGRYARSNAELVERVARLATEFGRELASPQEARIILAAGMREGTNYEAGSRKGRRIAQQGRGLSSSKGGHAHH